MPENRSTSLATRSTSAIQLQSFEQGLLAFIGERGLPTESVFVSIGERETVFVNVDSVLAKLDQSRLSSSFYIAKFIAAVASGLFDAALNYLWDETIHELRIRVAQYDIGYFFDNAVGAEKRKKLSGPEDLNRLDDSELITGAHKIELISDLGFKHLDFIRYMRNWASAAHPNNNTLTGLQLISWLETCILEVINLPVSNVVAEIGKLLSNIKGSSIDAASAKQIGVFFTNLTLDQVNTLASGFFGIYTQDTTTQQSRQNIHQLLPYLWGRVDERTRQQFGIKYGKFVATGEQQQQAWARQFLDVVGGASYIPDSLRAAEIQTAVENLLGAHRGWSNFHTEPPFARELQRLVGASANVPKEAMHSYVIGLVEVFLTNGNGVAHAADLVYQQLFAKFDGSQALLAILSFNESNIASRLQFQLCGKKFRELLTLMQPKLTAPAAREVLADITQFQGPLDKLRNDSRIKTKVDNLLKILRP